VWVGLGGRLLGFRDNVLRDNGLAGLQLTAAALGSLDEASDYLSGNGRPYLDVRAVPAASPYEQLGSNAQTWRVTSLPIRFDHSVVIVSSGVTVVPGARLVFAPGAGLLAANTGFLRAAGSAARPIRFAAERAVPGSWKGISIHSSNQANELTHVEVVDAGDAPGFFAPSPAPGGVMVGTHGALRITNSVVHRSSGAGLTVSTSGVLIEIRNVVLRDNAHAGLQVPANALAGLDPASDYASGNGRQFVEVVADGFTGYEPLIGGAHTWRITSLPLRFGNGVSVRSALTVLPGVRLVFRPGAGLDVVNSGSLVAIGTAAAPITFTGEPAQPGSWEGLTIQSSVGSNELRHVTVRFGGAPNRLLGAQAGNIVLGPRGRLHLWDATVGNSAGWGVWVAVGGAVAPSPLGSGRNTFSGNALGNANVP